MYDNLEGVPPKVRLAYHIIETSRNKSSDQKMVQDARKTICDYLTSSSGGNRKKKTPGAEMAENYGNYSS